jgi:hypothetical protein
MTKKAIKIEMHSLAVVIEVFAARLSFLCHRYSESSKGYKYFSSPTVGTICVQVQYWYLQSVG